MSSSASWKNSSSPRLALLEFLADGGVIVIAVLDRVVEDCRVGRQPGDRKLVNVAAQRAAAQQVACDVVEPEALAEVVEGLSRLHGVTIPRPRQVPVRA